MIELSNSKIEATILTARQDYGRGRFDEAAKLLESLPQGALGEGEDNLLLLGACYARLRRTADAVGIYKSVLERNPNSFEALTWMAVLKKNRQEIAEAIQFAERAVKLEPGQAAGYGALGACHLYNNNATEAIDTFRRAVELDPGVAEHEHNLGLAYLMAHRHGEAIPHLRNAIAIAPQNPQSYLTLAGAYSLYGMAGEALECLSAGLENIPDSPGLHCAAGSAFASIRNDAAAERHYRRAVELSPTSRGAYAGFLLNQGGSRKRMQSTTR